MVEGKNSFSSERQWPEVRTYQVQSPQQNLEILSPEIYSHKHPTIKGSFSPKKLHRQVVSNIFGNWEKPTSDLTMLNIVKGYQIPFLSVSVQKSSPHLFQ